MPIVELVKWSASDAYVADHSILKPTLDFIAQQKGNLGVYSGPGDNIPRKTAHCFIVWDTIEDHEALMKDPHYPGNLKIMPALRSGYADMSMNHILFVNDWQKAISAHTTEILEMKLKPDATQDHLRRAIWALAAKLDADNRLYAPAAWGPTHEDAEKCYLLVGWESPQAHQEIMGKPEYKKLLDDLHAVADLETVHVHFKKHE